MLIICADLWKKDIRIFFIERMAQEVYHMKINTQKNHTRRISFLSLISLMAIAALLLSACQPAVIPNTGGSQIPTTAASPMPTTGGSQPQPQPASQSVTMVNTSFSPQQLTVKVGTTVIWTNKDTMVHTVTADDKSFDSGNLNPGDTFKFTFMKTGTFRYYCKIHGGPNGQGMSGIIVVTGG